MSLQVLANRSQIQTARQTMDRLGWSYRNSGLRELIWRGSRGRYPRVGDWIKSWDVLETVRFATDHLAKDDPILDLGAYSSEAPLSLYAAGFRQVSGIDLNPHIRFMPKAGRIRYVQGSFHAAPLPDAAFAMVTAISVIEHGYAPEKMLGEVARLLRPGGYFVASFDYWPDKIATDGVRIFDLDWLIFSANDVRALIDTAAQFGLEPVGPLQFAADERPVQFNQYQYTFGWLALQKRG